MHSDISIEAVLPNYRRDRPCRDGRNCVIMRSFFSVRQAVSWAMYLVAVVVVTEADNGGWHEGRADPRDGVGHEECPFLAIDAEKLTLEELKAKCVGPRVPCIIRNGLTGTSHWRRETFLER